MAEKADKKPDAAPAPSAGHGAADGEAAGKKGGLLTKTPVLLAGVMAIEAAVLLGGFMLLGKDPHAAAAGAEIATGEAGADGKGGAAPAKRTVEVPVLDFKAQNKLTGRTFIYDVSLYVVTRGEHEARVKETIKAREALIKDRVRTIIAQNDPEKLGGGSEPGLETLRRQVKYQLDEIVGDGLIDEVLVPRCIPFRTDF